MIPHLCLNTLSFEDHFMDRPKNSPATVLLRHRLGRRVAAETGLAAMLLRYRFLPVSWASFHTFFFSLYEFVVEDLLRSRLEVEKWHRT